MSCAKRPEIKSSARLGGRGPVESSLSGGSGSMHTSHTSERLYSPDGMFTIPLTFGTPKILCKLGWCRSPSITRVSLPLAPEPLLGSHRWYSCHSSNRDWLLGSPSAARPPPRTRGRYAEIGRLRRPPQRDLAASPRNRRECRPYPFVPACEAGNELPIVRLPSNSPRSRPSCQPSCLPKPQTQE